VLILPSKCGQIDFKIFTKGIYGNIVHIHTVDCKENILYFATYQDIFSDDVGGTRKLNVRA
jgi:hypothetical protein